MSNIAAASWFILCGASFALLAGCGAGAGQLSEGSGGGATGGGVVGGAGQGGEGGGGCTPSPELCNGFDDDCDGQVDEECPCVQGEEKACYSGDPSTNGVGACKSGTQKCDETGTFGSCDGEVTPSEEVCNKLDDDCNGEVDDDLGEETCGVGACQVTVKACVDGEAQSCMPGHPDPETCDGIDNDCDGTVDEGCDCIDGQKQACYTGAPATKNVGECKDGEQVCAGGKWSACTGDVVPATELCDGKDNNCDGQTDDGNPGSGQGCDTGNLGVCKAGQTACQGGALVCVQTLQPVPEKCDGLDNDCDGQSDEGNPEGGGMCNTGFPGICSAGTQICQNGALKCVQDKSAGPEQCNGLDDDCDGAVDEGNPGGGNSCNTGMPGICASGTQTCTGGALSCVQNQQAQAESCNNQDDDCDGQTDEGNPGGGGNCSTGLPGICAAGTQVCAGGSLQCQQSQQAQPEQCNNNQDDDCDGQTDEGCASCNFALASYSASAVFKDQLSSTTMTIAWDGSNYWSSSGGSGSGTRYARYSAAGALLATYAPGIDFRSVFTKGDGTPTLYARGYASNLIRRQTSPGVFTNDVTLASPAIDAQAAVVWDANKSEWIAQMDGALRRFNAGGANVATLTLSGFGSMNGEGNYPQERNIAWSSGCYLTYAQGVLSAWDASGTRVDTTTLSGAGTSFDSHFSLSYANGMVFVVDTAGGSWRGYKVGL